MIKGSTTFIIKTGYDFIKIEQKGYELENIKGEETNKPVLVLGFKNELIEDKPKGIFEYLDKIGYGYSRYLRWTIRNIYIHNLTLFVMEN